MKRQFVNLLYISGLSFSAVAIIGSTILSTSCNDEKIISKSTSFPLDFATLDYCVRNNDPDSYASRAKTNLSGAFNNDLDFKGMLNAVSNAMTIDSFFYAWMVSCWSTLHLLKNFGSIPSDAEITSISFQVRVESNMLINGTSFVGKISSVTKGWEEENISFSVEGKQKLCAIGTNIAIDNEPALVFGSIDPVRAEDHNLHFCSPIVGITDVWYSYIDCMGGTNATSNNILSTLFPAVTAWPHK